MISNLLKIEEFKIPNIEIDLENRLNNITFYPKNYNLEIKKHFEKYIEKTNQILLISEDIYTRDFFIKELQIYINKFGKEYINYLYLKCEHPSWTVTGRGNLNINKYNKVHNLRINKLNELNNLSEKFDKLLSKISTDIKKEHQKIQFLKNKAILDTVKKIPKFTRKKEEIVEENMKFNINIYRFKDYKIYKVFGNWRVLNQSDKIIYKSNQLINCKKYIALLCENKILGDIY